MVELAARCSRRIGPEAASEGEASVPCSECRWDRAAGLRGGGGIRLQGLLGVEAGNDPGKWLGNVVDLVAGLPGWMHEQTAAWEQETQRSL